MCHILKLKCLRSALYVMRDLLDVLRSLGSEILHYVQDDVFPGIIEMLLGACVFVHILGERNVSKSL